MTITITCPHAGCRAPIEVSAIVTRGWRNAVRVEDVEHPQACPETDAPYTDTDSRNIGLAIADWASDAISAMRHGE